MTLPKNSKKLKYFILYEVKNILCWDSNGNLQQYKVRTFFDIKHTAIIFHGFRKIIQKLLFPFENFYLKKSKAVQNIQIINTYFVMLMVPFNSCKRRLNDCFYLLFVAEHHNTYVKTVHTFVVNGCFGSFSDMFVICGPFGGGVGSLQTLLPYFFYLASYFKYISLGWTIRLV